MGECGVGAGRSIKRSRVVRMQLSFMVGMEERAGADPLSNSTGGCETIGRLKRGVWSIRCDLSGRSNHARKVGCPLHALRCVALNVIRQQGFRYVPDGHRAAPALPDRGLVLEH